jgi:hypothetical protein
METSNSKLGEGRVAPSPFVDPQMTEVLLLLPSWQLAALETAARAEGITAAQIIRRLIGDFLLRSVTNDGTSYQP